MHPLALKTGATNFIRQNKSGGVAPEYELLFFCCFGER